MNRQWRICFDAIEWYNLLDGFPPWPKMNGLKAVRAASQQGERPEQNQKWDSRLRHVMSEAWRDKAAARPPFKKIVTILTEYQQDVHPVQTTKTGGPIPGSPLADTGCSCTIL